MTYTIKSIGDVTDILSGYAFDSSCFDKGSGIKLIRIRDVMRGFSQTEYSGEYGRKYVIKRGDMLIGMDGEFNIARWQSNDALLNQRVCKISVSNQQLLDENYLYHFLPAQLKTIEDATPFVTVKHLSVKTINQIQIPLPPLAQQQRIAAILDKATEIKLMREQAIAKLDKLAQSTFVEMFGDPLLNDKNHKTYKVDEICKIVRGSSPRPQGDTKYFGGNVPRLMVADLTRDGWSVTPRIDSLTEEGAKKSRPVKAGTVVMAVSGNPGLVSQLAVDACIHDGFVGFTDLDEEVCRPTFLLALMHMSKAAHDKNKAGAIFVNLKTEDIKAMALPIPAMQEQIAFEKFLLKLDDVKASLQKHAALYQSSMLSLQHQAFTTGFNA